MEIVIDPDVKAVAEFMQKSMPAAKLVSVASAVAALAPILWKRYQREDVDVLTLRHPQPPFVNNSTSLPIASECAPVCTCVGDGSAAARDAAEPT